MITPEILEEYQTYTTSSKTSELTPEAQAEAKALGEKRKAFLKRVGKELGLSAKKLEKDIGKLLKKQLPKNSNADGNAGKKKKKEKKEEVKAEEEEIEQASTTLKRMLKPPEENTGRGGYYVNSPEILKKHLEATGGKWQTRFPPEPNGRLHIGHAKAMSVDFGTAKNNGGGCILRYDDTNPSGEKQEFIDGIENNAMWLGHSWIKQTHTSDYFEKLYELAMELISRDKAYVCHQTAEEVRESRAELMKFHGGEEKKKGGVPSDKAKSPWRDRPIEESKKLFKQMRQGRFAEGEATLRMKMDLLSPNPNMWDQMAYRIIYKSHPRTKDKWCIYPTYDYSHCLIDSLENITHSLCSLEFESRQSNDGSYHWLLWALDMYHPQTWEFSRCSISCNVMSKRRLKQLVEDKLVSGWDDPRLLTLDGLRRRGYTASAINTFCEGIGIARSSNEVCVAKELLEHTVRKELNDTAERRFAIIAPLKVTLVNFKEKGKSKVSVPRFPQNLELGMREVDYSEVVYIPKHKFKMKKEKGYKGLVLGEEAKLLYADAIRCIEAKTNASNEIDHLICEIIPESDLAKANNGKAPHLASIPWVGSNGIECEARLFEPIFHDCDVDGVEVNAEKATKAKGLKSFLELYNKDSLTVQKILVERSVGEESDGRKADKKSYQFMTVGYFTPDKDSTVSNPVFNRVVTLKESKSLKTFKIESKK